MKQLLLAAAASLALLTAADAATLTLPSFTIKGPVGAVILCSSTPVNLTAPVASGTVMNTCSVTPATWNGVISQSSNTLALVWTPGTTNQFSLVVGAVPLAAGAYPANTLTSAP